MKKWLYTVLVFTRLNTRRFFRDRLALFFGVLFPVIFLFVFGGIAGNGNNVSFKVALINQSDTKVARDFVVQTKKNAVLKVDEKITTLAEANEKLTKSQIDSIIVLPPDFGRQVGALPHGQAEVRFSPNSSSAGQAVTSVLDQQFKADNSKLVHSETPFTVVPKQTAQKSLEPFDYTFAGLLGFSIIGLGIFGPINIFPELKKQGILRRLHTTPLKVSQYFVSTMISQAIIGLVSLAVMFAVAIAVFHLHVVGNYLEIIPFIVFSIITILGIGLAIGGWAKNERQAAPLSNIIVFPMMFLSGTFFPRFAMPEWLQNISTFLPLTPVIDGLRLLTTEGKHLVDLGPQLGLMAAWTLIIYIVAFRLFRWE
jgi:ABC-2 type transport system permease protein